VYEDFLGSRRARISQLSVGVLLIFGLAIGWVQKAGAIYIEVGMGTTVNMGAGPEDFIRELAWRRLGTGAMGQWTSIASGNKTDCSTSGSYGWGKPQIAFYSEYKQLSRGFRSRRYMKHGLGEIKHGLF